MNNKRYPRILIDLNAFNSNINYIREKFKNSKIILPVKANAYGHGDIIIAKEAEEIGIEYLAVARVYEGIRLRENGITVPIIDFGVEYDSDIKLAIECNIELSVSMLDNIKEIEKYAKISNKSVPLHLKVNTGMNRLGVNLEDAFNLASYIYNSRYLKLKSIYTHFARSDDSLEFTKFQIKKINELRNNLTKKNIIPEFYHLFNSGAIMGDYDHDENDYLRPGIMAYGYSPFKDNDKDKFLKPVMTFVSRVIHLNKVKKNSGVSYNHTFVTNKDTILATICAGYGDGIFRSLSNKLKVKINNNIYNQIGTITMDLMVIEVDKEVKIGDEVYIFGNKQNAFYNAKDLATLCNTISYEITTNISERVERIAISDN
ncbi:MAG TPA: alanine racemase [Spirochaetota bacterium]|nr:alanine racemase [Spirochaetota bacterium]HOL57639.1 alanine racemase [Spirochaetota bacterium]HPP05088.1 alanine racemase [Spirochaetota bacterium]